MEHDRTLEQQRPVRRPARRPAPTPGAAGGVPGAPLLSLQRTAGNQAVASLVQRSLELDELGLDTSRPSPGGGRAVETPAGAASSSGAAPEGAAAGGINELGPVARVGTLIADSVVAASYTPGAGNVW